MDQVRRTVGQMHGVVIGLATVLAGITSWSLVGSALHPLRTLTRTVEALGRERTVVQRVTYAGPQDEIGRLVTTFNELLAAVQAAHTRREATVHAQRQFTADAAREVCTLVTTLCSKLALLQRTPPLDAVDRAAVLRDVARDVERVSRLVNDVLTRARGS